MCAFMPSSTCASGGRPARHRTPAATARRPVGVPAVGLQGVEVELGEVDVPRRHPPSRSSNRRGRGPPRPPAWSAGRCRGRTGPDPGRPPGRGAAPPSARRARRPPGPRPAHAGQTSESRPSSGGQRQPGLDRRPVRLVEAPHAGRVQRQQQVQPQRRVGRERAEHPLQLADPVAHRVVVEVQPAGRLRDVEVGLQQHPQRLPQVGGVGVGGVGQRAEHLVDVGAQLGAVGDQREQPEDAQLVEVGDRRRAVDLLPHPERALRLPVRLGQRRQRLGRAGRCRCRAAARPARSRPFTRDVTAATSAETSSGVGRRAAAA